MDIGLFYQIQVPKPWSTDSESKRYWEMLEEVTYAEEIGMTSVWFVEHHFRSEWSHSSAPDITLAAISQRTTKMRLGIAVVLVPLHHPLNIASRMATLDVVSNGRVDLGIGRSGYPYQMMPYGSDLKDVSGMLEEYLKIIPGAWTEEEFSFEGQYYHIPPREVVPKPVQKPLPIMVGGMGERRTLKIVAELADEWNSLGVTIDDYKHKTEVLKGHCAAVGRDPCGIKHSQMSGFIVGKDDQGIRRHLVNIGRKLKSDAIVGSMTADPSNVLAEARTRGWLVGTPSQLVDELGKREEAGISRVMLQHHANHRTVKFRRPPLQTHDPKHLSNLHFPTKPPGAKYSRDPFYQNRYRAFSSCPQRLLPSCGFLPQAPRRLR